MNYSLTVEYRNVVESETTTMLVFRTVCDENIKVLVSKVLDTVIN